MSSVNGLEGAITIYVNATGNESASSTSYLSAANTLEVAISNRLYTSISSAISVASAGVVVLVYPGIYPEKILLTKDTNLKFFPNVTISGITANTSGINIEISGNISFTNNPGILISSGTALIHDSILVMKTGNPDVCIQKEGGKLILQNVTIVNKSISGLCISASAAQDVNLHGELNTSNTKGENINFVLDYTQWY